jgi:transposase
VLARIAKGESVRAAAKAVGVSPSTLQRAKDRRRTAAELAAKEKP